MGIFDTIKNIDEFVDKGIAKTVGTVITIAIKKYDELVGKNLVVLGMQESGKTQFIKTLQNKPYSEYLQTAESDFDTFEVSLHNGKTIKFSRGTDIGGSDHYISQNRELASKADIAILVFDAYKFYTDQEEYVFQTRVRFDFFKDGIGSPKQKIVVGSFADKFSTKAEKERAKKFVFDNLKDVYPDLCDSLFFMIDMRKRDQVLKICEKIFS